MIRNEFTDSQIEECVKEVMAELDRPDPGLSVKQITREKGNEGGGQFGLPDPAGTWEIRFSDNNTLPLLLTFGEKYDAGSEKSETLKAAIRRSLLPKVT